MSLLKSRVKAVVAASGSIVISVDRVCSSFEEVPLKYIHMSHGNRLAAQCAYTVLPKIKLFTYEQEMKFNVTVHTEFMVSGVHICSTIYCTIMVW